MKITNPNAVKAYFTIFKDCDCPVRFPEWSYGDPCECGSGIKEQYELEPNQTLEVPEPSKVDNLKLHWQLKHDN